METAELEVLIDICRKFNEYNVKYIVCGAFAGILHGVERISKQYRPTKDYDFIIDGSGENVVKIKDALKNFFSRIDELREDDFEKYSTIQIVEENSNLILDLIVKMWDIDYKRAIKDTVIIRNRGVDVPVLSIDNLIEIKKNSFRPQDKFDTYWLMKIKEEKSK